MSPHAEEWIRGFVDPAGPIELVHDRPWARVMRVATTDHIVWFKACAPVQAFEARLSTELFRRWPDRVGEVLGHDEERAWLLLRDAGEPIGTLGNPPELWMHALPGYAELQRGEAMHVADHLSYGVPDLRLHTLPDRYADLVQRDLPLDEHEISQMRRFAARFQELCADLAMCGVPESIQHDDLHMANLYIRGRDARILDWGDSSISHPFASLVVTFRFLEERNGLPPSDPWFERLRDAYLEPWGTGLRETFTLAMRVGSIAHAIAWLRQRDALAPEARSEFDTGFSVVLRRALGRMETP